MCRGAPPPPPPPPAPPVYRATGTTKPPAPEPTARRVVTGSQRVATMTRRPDETGGGRRTNRLGSLRRLGTNSLRIPLLKISDLNYPL